MNASRRNFLKGLAAAAGLGVAAPAAYLGLKARGVLPGTNHETAASAEPTVMPTAQPSRPAAPSASQHPVSTAKALVVVQMAGGNDGLATVMPFADPAFKANRP